MAGHLTRREAPKKWPIERKGTAYIVRPKFSVKEGLPLLIVMREIMGIAQNRREAKKILHERKILVNCKPAKDEKNTVLLFDTLNVIPMKKCYRLELSENGKFYLEEIKESESTRKIAKIINKKRLKGKKTQLNLSDGRNFISDLKCSTNDSVLINLKENKIEKHLPLKEKAKVIIFLGKHVGERGEIIEIIKERAMAKIKSNSKEINILINQLMVTEDE